MESLLKYLSLACLITTQLPPSRAGTAVLSTSAPNTQQQRGLYREARNGFGESRYGTGSGRGFLERLTQDRQPTKCSRCLDDRYNEEYDRYDDDRRRPSHRPTYGSRYDRNEEEEDRKGTRNGTDDDRRANRRPYDDRRYPYDDRNDRYDRNRYGDRADYYDRFLPRDPYASDDGYRRGYERDRYDEEGYGGGGGRYGGGGGAGAADYERRRPAYEDRYDAYDDRAYGRDRYHDSFRPWDETYRGSAGFDAGGRGYYFASGRPDAGATSGWTRPEGARYPHDRYDRPDLGYGTYGRPAADYDRQDPYARDPYARPDLYDRQDPYGRPSVSDYGRPTGSEGYGRPTGSDGYGRPTGSDGYGRPTGSEGYGRPTGSEGYGRPTGSEGYGRPSAGGWHDVGEKRPPSGWHSAGNSGWRDQNSAGGGGGGGGSARGSNSDHYGQAGSSTAGYGQTTTTQGNSYLFEREGDATVKIATMDKNNSTASSSL